MTGKVWLLVIFCAVSASYGYPLGCNNGPKYWCRTEKTAEECNVKTFCRIMEAEGIIKMKSTKEQSVVDAPPVNFSLYYESLCPGCRAMIRSQIFPTHEALKGTGILNINLYPYGNAYEKQVGQKWSFQCQHGAEECQLNLVETCAIDLLPQVDHIPFIYCLETKPSLKHAKVCANQLGVEWDPIMTCVNGSRGNYLEHQIAEKTDALKPPHQYVPWITVNSVHTDDIQQKASYNLLKYVCSVYQGTPPPACNAVLSEGKMKKRLEACYR